jgi:hypothetical protein
MLNYDGVSRFTVIILLTTMILTRIFIQYG